MSSIPPKSIPIAAPAQTLGNGCLNGAFYFPEGLMSEIFLHLPIKHLLRVRCVCKSWCYLIDSTSFVKTHLQRNIECSPDSHIILRSSPSGNKFCLADVHSLSDSPAVEIDDPVKTHLSGAEFIGSCNGVVCLLKNNIDILLWNPATRKLRVAPRNKIALPFGLMQASIVGFGYDHINDDYKVVRIPGGQIWALMVTVYSLKNNSWTQPEILSNQTRITSKCGTYANGSLYWLAITKDSPAIFAFDLGVEKHRELSLPACVNKADVNHMDLSVFNSCLWLFDLIPGSCTDIWAMNENKAQNPWSKLISVEQPAGICRSINVAPAAFLKTQKDFLLVAEDDTFMWYDRVKNEVKNVTIDGFPDSFQMLVYTESIVQLGSDFNLDEKESEETEEAATIHEEFTKEEEEEYEKMVFEWIEM